jgi:hypothetical protein
MPTQKRHMIYGTPGSPRPPLHPQDAMCRLLMFMCMAPSQKSLIRKYFTSNSLFLKDMAKDPAPFNLKDHRQRGQVLGLLVASVVLKSCRFAAWFLA